MRDACLAAGHLYYFLEDVYPRMSGRRVLKTPALLRALFHDEAELIHPMQDDVPTADQVPQEQHRVANNGFPAPGIVPPPPGFNQGKDHNKEAQDPPASPWRNDHLSLSCTFVKGCQKVI